MYLTGPEDVEMFDGLAVSPWILNHLAGRPSHVEVCPYARLGIDADVTVKPEVVPVNELTYDETLSSAMPEPTVPPVATAAADGSSGV